jgi:hypothetical protein
MVNYHFAKELAGIKGVEVYQFSTYAIPRK